MINPVKYVLYDSQVPDSNPPVIVVRSDEMAFGTITFTLPIKHVPSPTCDTIYGNDIRVKNS